MSPLIFKSGVQVLCYILDFCLPYYTCIFIDFTSITRGRLSRRRNSRAIQKGILTSLYIHQLFTDISTLCPLKALIQYQINCWCEFEMDYKLKKN